MQLFAFTDPNSLRGINLVLINAIAYQVVLILAQKCELSNIFLI